MIQDLIILGLLMDGPKHGYQIKKLIREIAAKYASIESTSIYYPLTRMQKEGLLSEKHIKTKKHHEKFVYHITQKGRAAFKKMLYKNFLMLERPFINTDISLYFLKYTDKNMVNKRLRQRMNWLKRIENWLIKTKGDLEKDRRKKSLALIIRHNIELIKTEMKFIRYLTKCAF